MSDMADDPEIATLQRTLLVADLEARIVEARARTMVAQVSLSEARAQIADMRTSNDQRRTAAAARRASSDQGD